MHLYLCLLEHHITTMEQQQEQEQGHRRRVHRSILDAIAHVRIRFDDDNDGRMQQARQQQQRQQQRNRRMTMCVKHAHGVDRYSVQYLVDFLRGDDAHEEEEDSSSHEQQQQQVTELELRNFRLSHTPSDGGLDVLREFFANDTKLTKVEFVYCNFGNAADTSQLLSAFETNTSVTDLSLWRIRNLNGAALGVCLSNLLPHNTHLLRLQCSVDGVRALQPGLRSINRHLKELVLSICRDEGLSLLVDDLVGNTTLEILDISWNGMTPTCLGNVTRLVEFTRLKEITLRCDYDPDFMRNELEAGMQRFNSILQNKNTSLEKISGFGFDRLATVNSICARNKSIWRADALLVLQPRTGTPIPSKSGVWYKAFAKLAGRYNSHVNVYPGTSAIFKILQARPALLEKQLQRPTIASRQGQQQSSTQSSTDQDISDNHNDDMKQAAPTDNSGPKRRRL